jgi:hypothetical protein
MKKNYLFIALLLIASYGFSQVVTIAFTSFEEVDLTGVSGNYTDTGSNTTAHNMSNNALPEPPIDTFPNPSEMGMDARYVPYDSPSTGMTDGDILGVSDYIGNVGAYTDGTQGYKFSDTDGTFELYSDIIDISGHNDVIFTMDYFINSTTYEGDGTQNNLTDDRMSIIAYNTLGDSQIILETAGSDIDDLGIEGVWYSGNINIDPTWNTFYVVIRVQTNSNSETLYIDNLRLVGRTSLSVDNFSLNKIKYYPNPVTNMLNIETSDTISEVAVFNVLGQQVFRKDNDLNTAQIDMSGFSKGAYFVKVKIKDTVDVFKIIKQ